MSGFLGAIFASFVNAIASVTDPLFNYVTLLLNGDGTNGAQNNTFLDSSSNTFTITRTGSPTQGTFSPFSQTGWSGYFGGATDYITTPSNAAFTLSADFTIEAWIYVPTSGTTAGIISNYVSTATVGVQLVLSSINILTVRLGTDTVANQIIDSTAIPLNTWVHVAAVRNGNTLTLYRNGVSVGTPVTVTYTPATTTVSIGRLYTNLTTFPFLGYISNARIVKGTAVYTSNFTPPTSPLTAVTGTSLLTVQSNRFTDNSIANAGVGFPLTITGTPSIQAFSPFAPTIPYSAAVVGGSGYFSGAVDYLTTPANTALAMGAGNFTIECFFYKTATTDGALNDYAAGGGYGVVIQNNNIQTFTSLNGPSVVNFAGTIPLNQWNHLALVKTSGTIACYLNGLIIGTPTANSVTFTSPSTLVIGRNGGTGAQFFPGYISNLREVPGTAVYSGTSTSIANFVVPTGPLTATAAANPYGGSGTAAINSGTGLLLNFTNAGIADATAKNDLVTSGTAQIAAGSVSPTATGVISASTIVVSSAAGLFNGQSVTGTGIGTNAVVTNIVSTTITLSVANSGTVSGTVTFTNPVKFGTGSIYIPNGSPIPNAGSSQNYNMGSGNFTIEGWVRFTIVADSSSEKGVFQISPATTGYQATNTNSIGLTSDAIDGSLILIAAGVANATAFVPTVNTWYNFAIVRSSGTTKLYINALQIVSVADATAYTGSYLAVGVAHAIGACLTGYIDDFRITKGIARYTGSSTTVPNFTVPTAAFPVQ